MDGEKSCFLSHFWIWTQKKVLTQQNPADDYFTTFYTRLLRFRIPILKKKYLLMSRPSLDYSLCKNDTDLDKVNMFYYVFLYVFIIYMCSLLQPNSAWEVYFPEIFLEARL